VWFPKRSANAVIQNFNFIFKYHTTSKSVIINNIYLLIGCVHSLIFSVLFKLDSGGTFFKLTIIINLIKVLNWC